MGKKKGKSTSGRASDCAKSFEQPGSSQHEAQSRGSQVGPSQTHQRPPQEPFPELPQEPHQLQRAWLRGPPTGPSQTLQGPPQPQGAWSRGPPTGPSQTFYEPSQGPSQPQGTRSRGPPTGPSQTFYEPSQGPSQPQGTRSRDPPTGPSQTFYEPSQGPSKPQGARSKGSSYGSDKSDKQEKKFSQDKKKKQSAELEVSVEFAPRIYATKKSGKRIEITSNFFPLILSDPNIIIFHYDVVIEPNKPRNLFRQVWNKFVSLMFPGRLTAFDGKSAYSKGPLTDEECSSAIVTVFNSDNNKDKEFHVTIKEVRRISLSCFHNFQKKIRENRSMKVLPEAELAVLDIIMRNWACDHFVKNNRSFFYLASTNPKSEDLSNKLCMRFGYFQAAFLGYKLYLNFDITHKAFYKSCSVLDIVDCFRISKGQNIDIDQMTVFMRSVKIEYSPPSSRSCKRIFRVNKLVNDANRQSFRKEDGTEITVRKYFETEKKYKLRYPDLPLLWVGSTQKSIYIPMEFCTILSDQIYSGPIDPSEVKVMVQKSTSNARERKGNLMMVFNKTNINSHPLMNEFGLKVSNEMERVPARVLDPPKLKTSQNIKVDHGVWRIQNFLAPVSLNKWCILNLDKYLRKQNIDNLQNMIKIKGNDFNMKVADPAKSTINGDSSFMALKKIFSQLKDMQMVFVIIPDIKVVYSRVKAICETQDGILTQCVKSKTVSQDSRKLVTTVQNILLKVNAKLGGKNHCLDQSSTPRCLNGYVMVAGADVTHSSPGMTIPSVAAVTVTCEPAAFQYSTTTRVQPKGEMIKDLEDIMIKHLKEFHAIRGKYPERIIFFRDGVSEGELEKVFKGELASLRRACTNYCQPKITFIVVQKRHHTRFYATCEADEDKNYNVPVGTCVDTDIVHPRDLNFYLVSHASILGTARPTRYRLLHDDNKLTDDEIETLSYYLCHLFARCNRSVSYPAPTYNAHLAAARVRAYLEGLNLLSGEDVNTIQSKIKDEISKISPMFFV